MAGNKKNALHRVFISYHHDSDQSYKDDLVEFAEKHDISSTSRWTQATFQTS